MNRRRFLKQMLALGASAPLGSLSLALGCNGSNGRNRTGAYGPLHAVPDDRTGLPLLALPEGFRYTTLGWTGDLLDDGTPTPANHDGMVAFRGDLGRIRLVRNHEQSDDSGAFALHVPTYDPAASGGTTTLEFDPRTASLARAMPTLAGTLMNCSGGPTPWGSWLTCEESTRGPGDPHLPRLERPHGYVFEVPAEGVAEAAPLRALGRLAHEAVAIDPETGAVYMTEDAPRAGLYRFSPRTPGRLDGGGRLEMLALVDAPGADLSRGQHTGSAYDVTWVGIEDPDPVDESVPSVFAQGLAGGGTTFSRLEGACFARGRLWFVSTNGGRAGCGQVFCFDPATSQLELTFESPDRDVLDCPDNLCVSPRGGVLLCEDGQATEILHVLSPDGELERFCENHVVIPTPVNGVTGDFRESEFAGACFDPSGRWLFVNVQSPGITFALTGPFERGSL